MSMTEVPPNPHIELIFRGFVISRVTDGSGTAIIDALRDSACHEPTIKIVEVTAEGRVLRFDRVDAGKPISIEVVGPKYPGIQVMQKDNDRFDRLASGNDRNDFRWHIDLGELQGRAVKVKPEQVSPIVTVNNGLFHTSDTSPLQILVKRRDASGTPLPIERFGQVASQFSGNIYLKNKNSKAIFKNGANEINLNPKSKYVMAFDCHCDVQPLQSDFPLVYQAVGVEENGAIAVVPVAERVELEIEPPLVGPTPGRTYCLGVNVS